MHRQLDAIWQAHRGELKSFIARRVRSQAEAEDILQDVFLKMLSNLGGVKRVDRLRAWLFAVTRHAVADHFRRLRPLEALPEDMAQPPPDPDTVLLEGLDACLWPFIDALPEKIREALILADLQGVKQQEAARRLGISLAAVKSRILRGRRLIRNMVEDCCHLEMDARGNVMDYSRRPDGVSPCGCRPPEPRAPESDPKSSDPVSPLS